MVAVIAYKPQAAGKGTLLSSKSQQGSPSRLLKQKAQGTESNKCILKEQSNDLQPALKTSPGAPARAPAPNGSFLFSKTKFLEYLLTTIVQVPSQVSDA